MGRIWKTHTMIWILQSLTKAAFFKKEMTDIMHQDLTKVKFETNKNIKIIKLSDVEIIDKFEPGVYF